MRRLIVLLVPLAACAPEYAYSPATHATATIRGHQAADYQVPARAPQGSVRLASFGFSKVRPAAGTGETEHVLHLRMIVSNDSAQPWQLDARQQQLDVRGVGRFAPVFASSRDGVTGFPMIQIQPGTSRSLDLFYRLPPGMDHARDVGQFDEIWRVDLPGETVVERTPFERLRVQPAYAYGWGPYYPDAWGPFWWGGWGPGWTVGWPGWYW